MELFKHQQMSAVYYSFHMQDPEWCIKSLLDLNNLSEDIFYNNSRNIIREKGEY